MIFLVKYSIILWCYFSYWQHLTSIKLATRKWRDEIQKIYQDSSATSVRMNNERNFYVGYITWNMS